MAQRRDWQQWRKIVEGWPHSGLTQREYCDRHGISVASLGRWREILRRQDQGRTHDNDVAPQLLPVQWVREANDAGALTLVLDDRLRVEVGNGFDGPTLKRLLAVLREAA
jgi:transposase